MTRNFSSVKILLFDEFLMGHCLLARGKRIMKASRAALIISCKRRRRKKRERESTVLPTASMSPRSLSRLRGDLRPRSSGRSGPRSRGCAKRREGTREARGRRDGALALGFSNVPREGWGGLIARDSRFEVAPPMFSGRLDSLPLRDPALSFSFLFPSLFFSFSLFSFPFHLFCNSRLYAESTEF